MNHNLTLSIAAIVAAMALTAVAFAIPQQALAHYRHHNNHNSNTIKVDQQVNQQNSCSSPAPLSPPDNKMTSQPLSQSSTDCQNFGDNQADIRK